MIHVEEGWASPVGMVSWDYQNLLGMVLGGMSGPYQ